MKLPNPRLFTFGRFAVILACLSLTTLSLRAAEEAAKEKEDTKESLGVAGLSFTYGAPWAKQPSSGFGRVAELVYGGDEGAPVLVFSHFPSSGGSTEANLARWAGQFDGEPAIEKETKEFDGTKVSFFFAKGTFLEGPPFGGNKTPRPGYMMLGAIVETGGGQGNVFLKLYGPEEKVEAIKPDFVSVVESPFAE